MATITVIGAGMMGSALVFPAAENGHKVRLVGTHLDRGIIDACRETGRHPKFTRDYPGGIGYFQTEETAEAVRGADFVICGVSSFGVDWFGENIFPLLSDGTVVLSVTKGLIWDAETAALISYPQYWEKNYGGRRLNLNAVGGPCTSYELVARDHSHVCFCGRDTAVLEFLAECMSTDYYHVSLSRDILGVEAAVALKNAYALGVSIGVGMTERAEGEGAVHYNSQAALFQQGVTEMAALLAFLGAGGENLFIGAGDLYVTVYGGRTRRLGILLGRGLSFDEAMKRLDGVTLESVVVSSRVAAAVRLLAAEGRLSEDDYPLMLRIDDILNRGAPAEIPWKSFVKK